MMTQREPESDQSIERCRATVASVIARHSWQLLTADEFLDRVLACVQRGEIADLWAAAINVYCHCLYHACRCDEGEDRQEQAFRELHRYLYELSFNKIRDISDAQRRACVNDALARIWEHLPLYRKPGAFLAIAHMELRNALRPWWNRPRPQRERGAWELPPVSLEHASAGQPEASEPDPLDQALGNELITRVQACFEEVLRRSPRIRQQLEAVWLKYINGFDDEAISRYLKKPVANIYVLRSRGLKRLRTEPSWQQLAQDFGLL